MFWLARTFDTFVDINFNKINIIDKINNMQNRFWSSIIETIGRLIC